MKEIIMILCGECVSVRYKPISVAKARRLYRKHMDIRPEFVAAMGAGSQSKRVHGNYKLKPGDKLVFMRTHGTIG